VITVNQGISVKGPVRTCERDDDGPGGYGRRSAVQSRRQAWVACARGAPRSGCLGVSDGRGCIVQCEIRKSAADGGNTEEGNRPQRTDEVHGEG
jgi:hypothetical protein